MPRVSDTIQRILEDENLSAQFRQMWEDPLLPRAALAKHFGVKRGSLYSIAKRLGLDTSRKRQSKSFGEAMLELLAAGKLPLEARRMITSVHERAYTPSRAQVQRALQQYGVVLAEVAVPDELLPKLREFQKVALRKYARRQDVAETQAPPADTVELGEGVVVVEDDAEEDNEVVIS